MIPRRFDEISFSDIQALLQNAVPEGRTIEYKRELPDERDKRKVQFLAAVSALANASGGDIVFGVEEKGGIPANILGLGMQDPDSQKLRLECILRDGVEPRIPDVKIRTVPCPDGKQVLVLRVGQSWAAPHRVSYKDHSKFYGRNSVGKYPLDVAELRAAFTSSELLVERIRRFREARVSALLTREDLPVVLSDGGILALHVIPLHAFAGAGRTLLAPTSDHARLVPPIDTHGVSYRVNLDGLVTYDNVNPMPRTYTQLFRSGVVEAVSTHTPIEGRLVLHPRWFEEKTIQSTGSYLSALRAFGLDGPVYIFISFIQMKGFKFDIVGYMMGSGEPLDRDLVLIPDVVLESTVQDPSVALRPAFDMVWNAFGRDRSPNYDQNGQRRPQ